MNTEESRPRRMTRAEAKARTRQLLLDAAAEVFARKGLAGASVDEIAEHAGFSTGALYSNFAGKEELFLELLSHRMVSRLSEAAAIVSNQDATAPGSRAALARFLIDVADNDTELAALQAEFWLYALRRPEFREQLADQFRTSRDRLAAALAARAAERGGRTDVAFDEVATVVLALFQGLVQLRRTDPSLVPETLYDTAVHWIFTGLNRTTGENEQP